MDGHPHGIYFHAETAFIRHATSQATTKQRPSNAQATLEQNLIMFFHEKQSHRHNLEEK
jgi:hypothetical protein